MGYFEEMQVQINNRDFSKFWQLWEEYCTSDTVDVQEFVSILKALKNADFAKTFGQYVETAIPLWETIKESDHSYEVLKHLIDLETTNTPKLANLALEAIKARYGEHPQLNDRLRMVGLRAKDSFQGALSYYELLAHMNKGKFVFHAGGWGTGEIVDFSPIREQVTVEFENVAGLKHFTFANAFKALTPLADDSFLARRFSQADQLEEEARKDPVKVIKQLLTELGPKTAGEIKDEMCELVIPEKEWAKWWQATRAKIKKDTMVETPESLKDSFRLHKEAVSHEQRLHKAIEKDSSIDQIIQTSYSFLRDNPAMLKKADVRESIQTKLNSALADPSLTKAQELQIRIFLETQMERAEETGKIHAIIHEITYFDDLIEQVDIIALKKRILVIIREQRKDWSEIFMNLLFTHQQNLIREYIFQELDQGETQKKLHEKLKELAIHPIKAPEFLVWYFQKIIGKGSEKYPFHDKEGQCLFFEGFLILFSLLDSKADYKELCKKMYNILSGKRYAVVRAVIEGTSLAFINEFLLLVAKCHAFSDQDQKIMRALAEVVQPSLTPLKQQRDHPHFDSHTIWTTEEAYNKTKERLEHINSVEIVQTAKEIEAARALGDLRENSEYKFAQEKRHRLQGEMRHLSEQLGRARIINEADILKDEVGVGNVVDVQDPEGQVTTYTILGPWDANPDNNILSSQSKLAHSMAGKKVGETFGFKDEEYKIISIRSFMDK